MLHDRLKRPSRRVILSWTTGILTVIVLFHIWLHITNPYAAINIVQQPYITKVENGQITIQKKFDLQVFSGSLASGLGYYKSGFLIVQNAWFGSYKAPSINADGIIADIHKLRFHPSKTYLISGDQFSVLYPRNLGVFYNSILDRNISLQDLQNRQRIYLQSALYALDAFSAAKKITTTIVPISPHGVLLTEVHPGSTASDSLYGVLYALDDLSSQPETMATTEQIVQTRKNDLKNLLTIYLNDVRDPKTGMVKRGIDLASARDGAIRDSSFYDNVILWKTLQLADKLGVQSSSNQDLEALRAKIMTIFWNDHDGYFKDDQKTSTYSADWLIALPARFLSSSDQTDKAKLARTIAYTHSHGIDQPFPIRYTASNTSVQAPWAVRTFVPNYGGDAIWSYWGAQYISLLGDMYKQTGAEDYKTTAQQYIQTYRQKIVVTRGFPETFTTKGDFLASPVYKSIRQTGWVVQFEAAQALLKKE